MVAQRSRHQNAAVRAAGRDRRPHHPRRRKPLLLQSRLTGLPGKDETLLREGCAALGLIPKGCKKFNLQAQIHKLPARYVRRYAAQDPVSTLLLFEDLNPILDQEGTRAAYRLDVDLRPLVLEVPPRGLRVAP